MKINPNETLRIEHYIISFNGGKDQLNRFIKYVKKTHFSPKMPNYLIIKDIITEVKDGREICFRKSGGYGSKKSIEKKILEIQKLLKKEIG